MPTGYTADVADGTITTLKDFAESCLRGMGVCVMMRDEPSNVPVPESFQVSTYHVDKMACYKQQLVDFVTTPEHKLREYYAEEVTRKTAELAIRVKQNDDTYNRYSDMIDLVYMLNPENAPNGLDLDGFKDFMLDQLKSSIQVDIPVKKVERELPAYMAQYHTWYVNELSSIAGNIKYHSENHIKDIKATSERNEWLKAARKMVVDVEAEVSKST